MSTEDPRDRVVAAAEALCDAKRDAERAFLSVEHAVVSARTSGAAKMIADRVMQSGKRLEQEVAAYRKWRDAA
jgi:ketosteroid isomerase-like protein